MRNGAGVGFGIDAVDAAGWDFCTRERLEGEVGEGRVGGRGGGCSVLEANWGGGPEEGRRVAGLWRAGGGRCGDFGVGSNGVWPVSGPGVDMGPGVGVVEGGSIWPVPGPGTGVFRPELAVVKELIVVARFRKSE